MPTTARYALLLISGGLFGYSIGDEATIGGWLYRYQTLVAGILALAGAALAYEAVQQQIRISREREEARRQRSDFAKRPVLAAALSALSGYIDRCLTVLIEALDCEREGGQLPVGDLPEYPKDIAATVSDCVETAEDPARTHMADLLLALQVHNARLRAIRTPPIDERLVPRQSIYDHIGDSADIYARASALFAYARRETLNYRGDYVQALGLVRHGHNRGDDEQIDASLDLQLRHFDRQARG